MLVFALSGCPVSPPASGPYWPESGSVDVTEFQYDLSATGTLSGSIDGTPFETSPSGADAAPDGDRLEVNIYFDEINAGLQWHLDYDHESGSWRSTASDGSDRFWFTYYPGADRLISQRSGSSALAADPGYSLYVAGKPGQPWIVSDIRAAFERGLTMAPAGEDADFSPITFTHADLQIAFEERGYVLTDHNSAYTPRELRFYDTSGALAALSTDAQSGALEDPEENLAELARELTAGLDDPGLKLRLIHDWVVSTIYYDMYALEGNRVAVEGPFEVVGTGAAVCEGLSRLVDYMCDAVGVHTRMITGRTPGQDAGFGHAWNAVSLNGRVLFFDPTFANRNYWNYDGGPVTSEGGIRSNYFLLEPEDWIHSHRPTKDIYQFLASPVGDAEFSNGSLHSTLISAFYDNFYKLDMSLSGDPPADRIAVRDEPALLTFNHPAGTYLNGFLRSVADLDADINTNLTSQSFIQPGDQSSTVLIQPAAAGDYWFYLQAKPAGASETDLVYVAILYVTSSEVAGSDTAGSDVSGSGSETDYPFPEQFQTRYREQEIVLESPTSGALSPGDEYTFRFTASGLTSATLYPYDSDGPDFAAARSFTEVETETWELIFTVPAAGDYRYFNVSTNAGSRSSAILRYYVE